MGNVGLISFLPPQLSEQEVEDVMKKEVGLWEQLNDSNRVKYDPSKLTLESFKMVMVDFYKDKSKKKRVRRKNKKT